MTVGQKIGRVLLFSSTLIVGSILVAMLGALGLFIMQRGLELSSVPEFMQGLGIVVTGIIVNLACVFILLQIKKADHKLVPPKK